MKKATPRKTDKQIALWPQSQIPLKKTSLARPRTKPRAGYPMVTAKRVSRDAEWVGPNLNNFSLIPANFNFAYYDICDAVSVVDPYCRRFVHTTVSLGNPGHKLLIQAATEARAREAITACNELASRCFPYAGGAEGIINSSLEQLARAGATCGEWVPRTSFERIERYFPAPIRSLRWQYADDQGTLRLVQLQPTSASPVPLQAIQTVYHALMLRDSNPYPIPPLLSALESCQMQRDIIKQIRTWVAKASSMGILLASVKAPPRVPGEDQQAYDNKSQIYLDAIADSVAHNLADGLAIGFDNIDFQFQNLSAGAEGAKETLQVALQSLFSALQRDPIWFGWNFGLSEAALRVIFQELLQGLKIYQQGAIRVLEHGYRLNLALLGMGDVAVRVRMLDNMTVDLFKEAEATQMKAQAIATQLEAQIIDIPEARKLLGHEDINIESGAYVAAFNRGADDYSLVPFETSKWQGADLALSPGGVHGSDQETDNSEQPDGGQREGVHLRSLPGGVGASRAAGSDDTRD